MYAITSATDYVGKPLVEELLSKGKKVRAIDMDTYKLRDLQHKGATPLAGDVNDPEFVKSAFKGCEAVFCYIPRDIHTNDYQNYIRNISKNYADSVRYNNIKYVVLLSSVSAPLGKNGGIDAAIQELENQFSQLKDVNVINLRAGFWLENLLPQIELVIHRGIFASPVRGDIPMPVVCTIDIGQYAAKRLIDRNFTGNTIEYLLGAKDITFNELASIIGKAIYRTDIKYVQMKSSDFIKAYTQMGWSENIAKSITEWADAVNSGKYTPLYKRTTQSTTPLTAEIFAREVFAEEYHLFEVTA